MNGTNKNVPTEPDFWTAYVVGAYEGPAAKDFDGQDEEITYGQTLSDQGSAIYLEVIRDTAAYAGDATLPRTVPAAELERRVVLHEMAHNFADSFPHDGSPPDEGPMHVDNVLTGTSDSNRFVPWQLDLLRDETNPDGQL